MIKPFIPFTVLLAALSSVTNQASGQVHLLQDQLVTESPPQTIEDALAQGDAQRGAIVFFQPHMSCAKCHVGDGAEKPLGPDLSRFEEKVTAEHLLESVLHPSRKIRAGFDATVILTDNGKTLTGLVIDENDERVVMRDIARDGKRVTLSQSRIEVRKKSETSYMPAGLVNQLTSRQQFLDLLRYLIEIAEHGPLRAAELRPDPSLIVAQPIPEYEKTIDHAGMIADLDAAAFRRGAEIYERLCINCHGDKQHPGSLPTSLRFAEGKFKSGSDPYTMYQTLTRGFGMMVQQAWMVPQQKYDVIHYIREEYLKQSNPSQYFDVNEAYLAGLPSGDTRGPAPRNIQPWIVMNYGSSLIHTYEVGSDAKNFAYKGIAMRLDSGPGGVSRGRNWMVFDHDTLRMAAAWRGEGFIDWNGIMFNGRHNVHPRIAGTVAFENPTGPGWANPETGDFDDPRLRGRDDRLYGPLPRKWAHYKGLYHYKDESVVSYTVGAANVLETAGLGQSNRGPVFTRTFNIGPREREMILQVAHRNGATHLQALKSAQENLLAVQWGKDETSSKHHGRVARGDARTPEQEMSLLAGVQPLSGAKWKVEDGNLRLVVPAGDQPLRFTLWLTSMEDTMQAGDVLESLVVPHADRDLSQLTRGGPPRWASKLKTKAIVGDETGPFAVDVLTRPASNPWNCQLRLTGLDFFHDGRRAAVSTWDGDVWIVDGIDRPENGLSWQRIASGLFQPLGVRIIDQSIYLMCRDQLVILRDLNGDGETDFYENWNNDHQVTDHFHEFAMGLQTDDEGNFYYAKSARHALTALVPHHGTLLKISKDGSTTEILATGFRAANGVCLNADGTFIVTDQEGHWNPKNRINWVRKGGFYGNMFGYHDVTDSSDDAMSPPLCWITNAFDRSPAELLWVRSEKWGPLNGSLLNLSYGYGKVFVVPYEEVGGQMQGGMCELPIPRFPTGVMRGRFHPENGQLYLCGMFAWAGNQQQPGGFYRLRYTGRPVHLPTGLRATVKGVQLAFSGELDLDRAEDVRNYAVKVWSLKRTENYGSKHYDEHPLKVASASLSEDRRSLSLEIPGIQPTWCMEIRYSLTGSDGEAVNGLIHNTIHRLGEAE